MLQIASQTRKFSLQLKKYVSIFAKEEEMNIWEIGDQFKRRRRDCGFFTRTLAFFPGAIKMELAVSDWKL